jgi:hypothetical protein
VTDPTKSTQAPEPERFFSLSTQHVDNSVHGGVPRLRKERKSSSEAVMAKKSSNDASPRISTS